MPSNPRCCCRRIRIRKKRAPDECGDRADRQLAAAQHAARGRVAHDEERGACERGRRHEQPMVGAEHESQRVRHDQADEADQARHGDRGADHQRRREQQHALRASRPTRRAAPRSRRRAPADSACAPAAARRARPSAKSAANGTSSSVRAVGEVADQPQEDAGALGHAAERSQEHDRRRRERVEDDTGEQQPRRPRAARERPRRRRAVPSSRAAPANAAIGTAPAPRPRRCAETQYRDTTERRAARDAEHEGIGEGIAEQRLEHHPRDATAPRPPARRRQRAAAGCDARCRRPGPSLRRRRAPRMRLEPKSRSAPTPARSRTPPSSTNDSAPRTATRRAGRQHLHGALLGAEVERIAVQRAGEFQQRAVEIGARQRDVTRVHGDDAPVCDSGQGRPARPERRCWRGVGIAVQDHLGRDPDQPLGRRARPGVARARRRGSGRRQS